MLFAIPALTLAGLPPTAGFVAKLSSCRQAPRPARADGVAAGVVILASLLTLYALAKVWVLAFWRSPRPTVEDPDPDDELEVGTARTPWPMYAATAGLVVVSLAIAVFAGPLSAVTGRAGADLVARDGYRVAVLGSGHGEAGAAARRRPRWSAQVRPRVLEIVLAHAGVGAAVGHVHTAVDRRRAWSSRIGVHRGVPVPARGAVPARSARCGCSRWSATSSTTWSSRAPG